MKPGKIRALALCVFRRDDDILVVKGYDSVKGERFYRPAGGGIEFGEHSREAVAREIREELGAEITDLRYLGTLENIFTCYGVAGHEIVMMYEGAFADRSFYARDVVAGDEGGVAFELAWMPLSGFARGDAPLYPDGLLALLRR